MIYRLESVLGDLLAEVSAPSLADALRMAQLLADELQRQVVVR